MKFAETSYDNSETGCCARLDVGRWDGQTLTWHDKPFLRDRVRNLLHVPLNFGSVMKRVHGTIESAAAYPEEPMVLTDAVSPWRSDVYAAVDRAMPGADVVHVSGTFVTKVFEGPYRNAGRWLREMQEYVRGKGQEATKTFFYYATCPKCAKYFGKNHIVLLARVN